MMKGERMGIARGLVLGVVLSVLGAACSPQSSEPPIPELDYAKALAMSDGAMRDILKNDSKDLSDRLDVGFEGQVRGPEDVAKVLQRMDRDFGKPLEFTFKYSEAGVRVDGAWKRARRTFWYNARTTKYAKGKYFLKIEVVRTFNGDNMDVSGFGFITFKNEVPSQLR